MPDSNEYEFACGDVMDGCDARFHGTREQVMGDVAEHASEVHGIDEVTPEVANAVEQHLQQVR